MVIGGTSAATAATVIELALATGSGISLGAEFLEDFGIRPDFVKRRVVYIARFFHHVGAGAHLANGTYDAVVETREASAAVTRLDAELVGDSQELRSASGFDGDTKRAALFHNLAKKSFVFSNTQGMTFNFLAATHGDEEEDLVIHRADFLDPVHDVENFVLVPVHDGGVNLERESCRLAVFDTHHRKFEGVRKATEFIVTIVIDTVDADSHRHGTSLLEFKGQVVRNERAIRAEHRTKSLARSVGHQFHNVRACHRLATAKDHNLEPRLRDFVNQLEGFCRCEFSSLIFACILVAVLAGQVTLVGGHPRYDHLKPQFSALKIERIPLAKHPFEPAILPVRRTIKNRLGVETVFSG